MPSADPQPNGSSVPNPPAPSSGKTAWALVYLAIGAGILAGVQVGKAHIALMSIRSSFALSLVDSSWILSALSIVGLLIATPVGSLAVRFGNKRTVAAGLMILALASAAGASAPNAQWLVITRLIEGLGFVLVVVAAPSLIVQITEPKYIRLVLAGWATFMPGGVALATLLAPPLLAGHTWRTVWLVDAAVLGLYAVMLMLVRSAGIRRTPQTAGPSHELTLLLDLQAVITSRGPALLAIIFALYTMQHLGIMGFMPTVLVENYGVSSIHAGVLVSIAMASNILGNLAAGVLLQRGVRRSVLIGGASILIALMSIGMFSAHLPLAGAYACCFLFSCVGGIVPGSVISAAPHHAPSNRLIPATNGLLVQGSNLGIVAGSPIIGAIATHAGWNWVPALTLISASCATTLAIILNRSVQSRLGNWRIDDADLSIH